MLEFYATTVLIYGMIIWAAAMCIARIGENPLDMGVNLPACFVVAAVPVLRLLVVVGIIIRIIKEALKNQS